MNTIYNILDLTDDDLKQLMGVEMLQLPALEPNSKMTRKYPWSVISWIALFDIISEKQLRVK